MLVEVVNLSRQLIKAIKSGQSNVVYEIEVLELVLVTEYESVEIEVLVVTGDVTLRELVGVP